MVQVLRWGGCSQGNSKKLQSADTGEGGWKQETEHTEAGQALGGHSAAQCKFLLQATDSRSWLATMLEMIHHAYTLPLRATILFPPPAHMETSI